MGNCGAQQGSSSSDQVDLEAPAERLQALSGGDEPESLRCTVADSIVFDPNDQLLRSSADRDHGMRRRGVFSHVW